MPTFQRKDLLWAGILIAVGALIHGVALMNPFYFDDLFVIRENAWLHGAWPPNGWFRTFWVDSHHLFSGYRPVLMLSFYLNRLFYGDTPAGFRIVNLALHILNSLWVAILFRNLYKANTRTWIPWIVGLFFLLHPIQTLGINFIWKRSELLITAIALTQMIAHIQARNRGKYPPLLTLGQVLSFGAALLIKESALLIPAYLLILDLLFFDWKDVWKIKAIRFLYSSLFLLGATYYFIRFGYIDQAIRSQRSVLPNWHTWDRWNYFKISLRVIPKYVMLWLAPAPRLIDDPRPIAGFPWADALASLFLFVLSILLSVRLRAIRWVPFGIALFWVSILPSASFIPLFFPMDQIRLYLPLVGLSGLSVIGLIWACDRIPRLLSSKWVFPAVLTVYAAHSWYQNRQYAVPAKIWQDVVQEYESSDVGWASLGQELAASKLHRSATIAFLMASRSETRNAGYQVLAYHNMLRVGVPPQQVKEWLSQTLMRSLSLPDTVNLAVLLRELDEKDGARFVLTDLLSRFPDYAPAHLQLGAILEIAGDKDGALHEYRRALDLMPNDFEAKIGIHRLRTSGSIELQ